MYSCVSKSCNFNYSIVHEEQESNLHKYIYFTEIKWINIHHFDRLTAHVKLNGWTKTLGGNKTIIMLQRYYTLSSEQL